MSDERPEITDELKSNIDELGSLLGEAIRKHDGEEQFELVESLRKDCKRAARENDEQLKQQIRDRIAELSIEQVERTVRAFSSFFHLVNKAEQVEITRINRQREIEATEGEPRDESVDEAFADLAQRDFSRDRMIDTLRRLDIQPTLTAHPTEARRRSILTLQERVAELLRRRQQQNLTPVERDELETSLSRDVTTLLLTDELRGRRRTVEDEVEFGIYFCTNSIWEALPRVQRDVYRAMRTYFGDEVEDAEVGAVLKYRSWIGGDRDGNPHVTPEITRKTLRMQRQAILERHLEEVEALREELSFSEHWAEIPAELEASIETDAEEIELSPGELTALHREPYRQKLAYMRERLKATMECDFFERPQPYDATRFAADLQVLLRALRETGIDERGHESRLGDLLARVKAFGFRLCTLDIRQHSAVHERAVAELLEVAGVSEGYTDMNESTRCELLSRELRNPRPLCPIGADLDEETARLLEVFEVARDAIASDPDAIKSYVVSMTHEVSDLLEVLLLARETGLWAWNDGKVRAGLDVVPLFETIEDLERCGDFMEEIFSDETYREHLRARGDYQELMLGYSDSNKDGGYWMANWSLRQGQRSLSRVCRDHDVDFCLFHGRGGTVGRGGGRANQAILALPPQSHTGHIRFTEQGEVISFRYAMPSIAHRHLEQIVNAMVRATALGTSEWENDLDGSEERRAELMTRIGECSMEAYRALLDADGFFEWYRQITPIEHISRLPIASRPVSRAGEGKIEFEGLRAIPWNFAWTQTRYNVPGWYGLGAGLRMVLEDGESDMEELRRLYREWPFFRAVIENAELEMARARMPVAEAYSELSEGGDFHSKIESEFRSSTDLVLEITEQARVLDRNPVIRALIDLRNPYTDVLNLMQIDLIRRWRTTPEEEEREQLEDVLLLSLNGVAAAMQSTG